MAEVGRVDRDLGGDDDLVPKARRLSGAWEGWGTSVKSAHEPIVVARKPLAEGSVERNVQANGTGAYNVAACLVPFADEGDEQEAKRKNQHLLFGSGPRRNRIYGDDRGARFNYEAAGRWPANVALGHADGCGAAGCAPGCPVGMLDDQAGERARGRRPASRSPGSGYGPGTFSSGTDDGEALDYSAGGPSRFFYCSKSSRAEHEAGCERLPERPMLWSSGEENPGTVQSERTHRTARNHHPTVKPLSLMRWLVRLVTPPGGTVLDPFAGSGSTGCAAVLEGFDFLGIERVPPTPRSLRRGCGSGRDQVRGSPNPARKRIPHSLHSPFRARRGTRPVAERCRRRLDTDPLSSVES